jgi:hypothetical protein
MRTPGSGMHAPRPAGRLAAATAVLILHGLLILLFLRADHGAKNGHPREEVYASILYLPRLLQQRPTPAAAGNMPRRAKFSRRRSMPRAPAPGTLPPTPSPSTPQPPNLDWQRAADEVAHTLTSQRRRSVVPGSGEHPHSPYRDCKQQPQFAWDPEPKRVGLIDHWLPYLRLGNHCIVSLGVFGCVVGALPGPNGHLLDPVLGGKATQSPTPAVQTWPDGEPRGLCRPSP